MLPFLFGESLVARVDLKAERKAGALAVLGAFGEPRIDRRQVPSELANELHRMANWLGLGRVRAG